MKKLFAVLSVVCLATLSFGAPDFVKSHRPKMKKPLPEQKIERKIIRQMPKQELQVPKKERMSWSEYLRKLEEEVADRTDYNFEGNIHPYLLKLQYTNYAVHDYQEISRYFQESFGIDPQQGTMEQYKAFYKAFNDLSPREHNLLPTIAIWRTGSADALIPFRHQMKGYWSDPQLAALAYDTMATIDYQATQKMMKEYMRIPAPSDVECEENQQMVKEFFNAWRAQADKNLPSVKDADALEELVLSR